MCFQQLNCFQYLTLHKLLCSYGPCLHHIWCLQYPFFCGWTSILCIEKNEFSAVGGLPGCFTLFLSLFLEVNKFSGRQVRKCATLSFHSCLCIYILQKYHSMAMCIWCSICFIVKPLIHEISMLDSSAESFFTLLFCKLVN